MGLQYLREVKDTIIQGFRWTMEAGPLAQEPVRGVKVVLVDAVLHEDPAHRGPAQIMPATKNSIMATLLSAKPVLLEPILKVDVKVPSQQVSGVLTVLNRHRGKIISMEEKGLVMRVLAELPVAESFNIADEMREATQGRAFFAYEFYRWAPVPSSQLEQIALTIRERKGLSKRLPTIEDFIGP
jgi:elongation factor 2